MGLTQITTGGVDDNINIDSNTLKVDGTNNRVGIGEASPSATLHANSGTTDVVADFESTDANAWIQIRDNSTTDTAVMVGAVGDDMRLRAGSNERVRIDSSGNVGIATADPKDALHVSGNIRAAADAGGRLILEDANQGDSSIPFYLFASDNGNLTFTSANRNASGGTTGSSERMRIDSSGRLLLGTTSSVGDDNNLQVVGSTADASSATFWRSSSDAGNPSINFVKTRGSVASPSIVSSGDILGHIRFNGYDGTDHNSRAAEIKSEVDGTPGTNDMPGRLVFSTTADGASSPTERMRIDSSGTVIVKAASANKGIELEANGSRVARFAVLNPGVDHTPYIGTLLGNDFYFITSNTERMRIDSSGLLGVGVSSPVAQVQINSDKNAETNKHQGGNYHLLLKNNGDDTGEAIGLAFSITTNATAVGAAILHERDGGGSRGSLQFLTNGGSDTIAERMRITNGGTVLIKGTSVVSRSQGVYLQVGEGDNSFGIQHNEGSDVVEVVTEVGTTTGRTVQAFKNPNGYVGAISISGQTTTFETTSDYRLKENIVDLADGIDRIKQLSPRRFNFIADANKTVDGFIAHEAQAVVPEAVRGTHNEVNDDGNPVYQGIDQSKLVPLLTAALQEAIAKIETLETKVAALEAAE
jgi:hypothetical protein